MAYSHHNVANAALEQMVLTAALVIFLTFNAHCCAYRTVPLNNKSNIETHNLIIAFFVGMQMMPSTETKQGNY